MPALADSIVMDYADKNKSKPSKVAGQHSRQKRPNVNLTEYLHTQGVKRAKKVARRRPKLDFDIFVCKMAAVRQWTRQQCKDWWEANRDERMADKGGHGADPTRLKVPSSLLGEDWSESEEENFEAKLLNTKMKEQKGMKEENKAKIRDELHTGFSALASPSAGTASKLVPLQEGAFTFEGECAIPQTLLQVLEEGIKKHRSGESSAPTTASSGGTAAPVTPLGAPAGESKIVFDISSKRLTFVRNARKETAALEKKLAQLVATMATQLEKHSYTVAKTEGEYHSCVERFVAALMWLNMAATKTKEENGKTVNNYCDMETVSVDALKSSADTKFYQPRI